MRYAGHVARMEGGERCIQGLGGESWGKESLGRSRRRWEDNIKMGLRQVEWWGMDGIDLVQYRDRRWAVVNAVMNLRVP